MVFRPGKTQNLKGIRYTYETKQQSAWSIGKHSTQIWGNPQLFAEASGSGSRLSRIEECVFTLTSLIEIIFPSSVEVLGEKCFADYRSPSSVTFESGSRLSQLERGVFSGTGLIEIIFPSSIKVLGEECFADCRSFSSVTFESRSRLREVG
jgi:hypothetical protein